MRDSVPQSRAEHARPAAHFIMKALQSANRPMKSCSSRRYPETQKLRVPLCIMYAFAILRSPDSQDRPAKLGRCQWTDEASPTLT
jgi:hypothetical protein